MTQAGYLTQGKAVGRTGLRYSGGLVLESFLPELTYPRAGEIYKEISENDSVVGAILYLAEMLMRGVKWSVESGDKEDELSNEAAQFVMSCLDDMETPWADTIGEILSMLIYGFSFHEVIYKIRRGPKETNGKFKSRYSDGLVGWRDLPIRSQESLQFWKFDEEGTATHFVQYAWNAPKIFEIPLTRGLLFRTRHSRNNPEGRSLLRNAYKSYYFKKYYEEIEAIGIERDLAGMPVLKAAPGLDLWDSNNPAMVKLLLEAESLVASIRSDSEAGIVLPDGWDFTLLASSSSRAVNIEQVIERLDKMLAITLLSDLVLLGDKSGSFALASVKQSMLSASLQAQLEIIASVFNSKAIPDLLAKNPKFDGCTMPILKPGKIVQPDIKEVALLMRSMGLNINKDLEVQNHLRELLSFPELSPEEHEEYYLSQEATDGMTDASGSYLEPDEADKIFEQNESNYNGDGGTTNEVR